MPSILSIFYLIASVTFILGLKMLSNPVTARRGNLIAAGGMIIAIAGTIFLYENDGQRLGNYPWIFAAIIIGSIIGTLTAKKVKMTAMPELVSFFNGMGGACAALISIVEFDYLFRSTRNLDSVLFSSAVPVGHYLAIIAGTIIGCVSFAGSVIAWGKLNGKLKDFSFKGQHIFNLVVLALVIASAIFTYNTQTSGANIPFFITVALALLYGVFFVLPIGGADMPVVISLLNSFTGVAAACGGFLYNNKAMLTGGILVGAAGTLLTILMCRAMNRSLKNVLIGSFGASANNAAAVKGVE
nr:NAD(P)(+) transhydrogenase (Re/Si-specific) subunit beta [Bacteroidota bacterium]